MSIEMTAAFEEDDLVKELLYDSDEASESESESEFNPDKIILESIPGPKEPPRPAPAPRPKEPPRPARSECSPPPARPPRPLRPPPRPRPERRARPPPSPPCKPCSKDEEWAPLSQYPQRNQVVDTQTRDNNRNMEMTAAYRQDSVNDLLNDNDESLEFESTRDQCYIHKVPREIRDVNKEAYTPKLISIGPLHYDNKKLCANKKTKEKYARQFFQQLPIEETEKAEKIRKIKSFIKDKERQIRDYYAKIISLESPEFVKMILYDSIFIIEIFLRVSLDNIRDKLLLANVDTLRADFQLFENQLPYFVLEEIYKLASVDISLPPFKDLCVNFFGKFMGVGLSALISDQVKHFTDWRRISLLEGYPSVPDKKCVSDLPCAVKLEKSGLKFKRIEIKKGQSVLDVKFEANELQIPWLVVNDSTERQLRNIMALEQCVYQENAQVCNYVELMGFLIDHPTDVGLLTENGIISNRMGNNASAATMFIKLNRNVRQCKSSYHKLCKQLKNHYSNPWNRAKTTLKRVHFSDPWRGTATVVATILLFLTIIQAICSILQVVKYN